VNFLPANITKRVIHEARSVSFTPSSIKPVCIITDDSHQNVDKNRIQKPRNISVLHKHTTKYRSMQEVFTTASIINCMDTSERTSSRFNIQIIMKASKHPLPQPKPQQNLAQKLTSKKDEKLE
jgi:hypothetical protein